MNTDKQQLKSEKASLKEQAINHRQTDGKAINQQEQQRRQKHQPRDKA